MKHIEVHPEHHTNEDKEAIYAVNTMIDAFSVGLPVEWMKGFIHNLKAGDDVNTAAYNAAYDWDF